jgi:hypothetical protein
VVGSPIVTQDLGTCGGALHKYKSYDNRMHFSLKHEFKLIMLIFSDLKIHFNNFICLVFIKDQLTMSRPHFLMYMPLIIPIKIMPSSVIWTDAELR